MTAILWPLAMAYLRGKIPAHELEKVFKHVLGEAGVTLASRLTYATIFALICLVPFSQRCQRYGRNGIPQKLCT